MEIKFKASFNWDLDLQSFIFGDMNDKGIRSFIHSLYYSQVTYTYNNMRSKYNTMSFSMISVAAK